MREKRRRRQGPLPLPCRGVQEDASRCAVQGAAPPGSASARGVGGSGSNGPDWVAVSELRPWPQMSRADHVGATSFAHPKTSSVGTHWNTD